MKNKKSAKDLAFERERAKFRKEIRELERENASLSLTLIERNVEIQEAEEEIRQLKNWVQRLLEYMDMPEEEMRKRIENERAKDKMLDTLGEFGQIFRRFGIL
ncbi:hypothetical protein B5F53_11645 [Blautia sp. An249]|uniref:hypothetical protein n=1 Tax=Blautia sp. An249 TaxID=1965603 RepID=UPI000B370F25|nr:hypothetical protein [Blautia sp. An249]OUO78194.1 hypothetical protein B5F53_11645 [Blautia sp. An249]